jgi:hypothetical protein
MNASDVILNELAEAVEQASGYLETNWEALQIWGPQLMTQVWYWTKIGALAAVLIGIIYLAFSLMLD